MAARAKKGAISVQVAESPEDARRRRLLFMTCQTREELRDWMLTYLDLELPDCTVDPDSDSNPFELIWEVYELMLRGGSEDLSEIMGYASRDSYKTLISAVLEVLAVFHHRRDVVHLAAIERQSLRAQKYVRRFLERPILRDFMTGEDNKRTLGVVWYQSGDSRLTAAEWRELPPKKRDAYVLHTYEIQVVVCTTSGVQGPHGEFMVVDEVDVIPNPAAYDDAKMIPGERTDRGQLPITLKISTRKSNFGLVQKEIDDAPKTGMAVRHWNVIDVTQRCPSSRHRPELPRLPIYVDPKELDAIDQSAYDATPEDKKAHYQQMEGYAGCLTNCRMFAACRGLLATKQQSTARTLKSVAATQLAFRRLGGAPDTANAQLLSRKPSSEGLIYPRIDRDIHLVTAAELLAKFTDHRTAELTAEELEEILVNEVGAEWYAGIDWGISHNFSVTVALVIKPFCIVTNFFESAGLEMEQRIELCRERGLLKSMPAIYPDMADPTSIRAFRKAGFRMRQWKKGPGSVMGGIQIMRAKMRPTMSEPELLFLADPSRPGPSNLLGQLEKYHFTKDAQGKWTDVPSEEGDDACDSCRYMVMNVFPPAGKGIQVAESGHPSMVVEKPAEPSPEELQAQRERQYFDAMMRHVGGGGDLVRVARKGRVTMLS